MFRRYLKTDTVLLCVLAALLLGLPLGIRAYDRVVWRARIPRGAKAFTLTGSTARGWTLGRVHAYEVLASSQPGPAVIPRIYVNKGDRVVLKLESSDVVHGFSLKDFGIFLANGIHPGRVALVSFVADKVGRFTFSCNAVCGPNHDTMKGILVVLNHQRIGRQSV